MHKAAATRLLAAILDGDIPIRNGADGVELIASLRKIICND